MYTLLVTQGPDAGLVHPIRETRVSVGRSPDMSIVLTDPSVRPNHFVVIFEEGGWKAITYEPDATILIDRRWEHPRTRERGARIFVGDTQLLLFAGQIDLSHNPLLLVVEVAGSSIQFYGSKTSRFQAQLELAAR